MSVETVNRVEVAAAQEKLPPWLIPVFSFFAGVALMFGVMQPATITAENEGKAAEARKLDEDFNQRSRTSFYEGVKSGYHACQSGEPMPVDTMK